MFQKAFKEEALSRTQVFEWFARFKRGEMSVEDHPHSGRPSTSRTEENVETIREQINEDRRYTTDEISEATGVNWSSCQRILTVDLNIRRVAATFVPRLLTKDQITLVWLRASSWKIRLKVTQTFFLRSSRATKVGAMGTTMRPYKLRANGRRPLHRDRKKEDKWGQMWKWGSLFFFDVRGIVHREFVPPGQTVNQEFTWRFWGDWERMCEKNAQNCGDRVIGFSIMTTSQLTQLCLWPDIWPLWDGPSFPTHRIHRT